MWELERNLFLRTMLGLKRYPNKYQTNDKYRTFENVNSSAENSKCIFWRRDYTFFRKIMQIMN